MTAWEFAQKMNISYHTSMRWLRSGMVPGAIKARNNRDWIVPDEALNMEKPKIGAPYKDGIIKTKAESAAIFGLKRELADLNIRHIELLEKYAGLQGRYEKEQNALNGAQVVIDKLQGELKIKNEAIDEICDDLKSLQGESKKLEDTLAYKDREIEKVWKKVRELQEEITNMSEDMNGKQLIIDNLNEECRRQQEEITRLKERDKLPFQIP